MIFVFCNVRMLEKAQIQPLESGFDTKEQNQDFLCTAVLRMTIQT